MRRATVALLVLALAAPLAATARTAGDRHRIATDALHAVSHLARIEHAHEARIRSWAHAHPGVAAREAQAELKRIEADTAVVRTLLAAGVEVVVASSGGKGGDGGSGGVGGNGGAGADAGLLYDHQLLVEGKAREDLLVIEIQAANTSLQQYGYALADGFQAAALVTLAHLEQDTTLLLDA